MKLNNWKSQIRKGLIEFCLMSIIERKKQAYGLELIEGLTQADLEVGEGTLYPLLSRLVREKYLVPRWETPETGHPRKYYRLSSLGRSQLAEMKTEWKKLTASIDEICNKDLRRKENAKRENRNPAQ